MSLCPSKDSGLAMAPEPAAQWAALILFSDTLAALVAAEAKAKEATP